MRRILILFLLLHCSFLVLEAGSVPRNSVPLPQSNAQKVLNVIGDSYVANHKAPKEETWHYRMAKDMGMKYNNYGKNGSCIAFDRTNDNGHNFGVAMFKRALSMDPDADYVIIIGGHNDAMKVGSSKDSLKMFADSLQLLFDNIHKRCPKAKIGFVTPWYVNHDGFSQVVSTIERLCAKNNIPVLNNYKKDCIIHVRDTSFQKRFFQSPTDNAHLNARGHGLFLPVGEKWFNENMKDSSLKIQIPGSKSETTVKVSVSQYLDGKKAAVSFTYDDGLREHYKYVAPELEKRGFRGSFWIIGNVVGLDSTKHGARLTWDQIRDMEQRGHDMGSHTWSHRNCKKIGNAEFMADVLRNDSAFMAELGHIPMTLAYPYNSHTDSVVEAIEQNRIGSRTIQVGHGQQNNKSTLEKMCNWLQKIIDTGDWGVTMTHGIYEGYDKWYHPEELWQFYDTVKAHTNEVWVGTFADVMAYQKERNHTFLTVSQRDKNTLIIHPECSLDPKIFHQPLTLCIDIEGKKKYVNFLPSDKEVVVKL